MLRQYLYHKYSQVQSKDWIWGVQTLQVLQQAAILHEFCDNVYRLLHGAHCVQLDQLLVPQFLHYLCLSQEILRVHGTCMTPHTGSQLILLGTSPPAQNGIMAGKQSREPNVRRKPQYIMVCSINNLLWIYPMKICSKSETFCMKNYSTRL